MKAAQANAVEIVEIIRRSEQGATRPFICRGDDGNIYFVKGRGAGTRSLLAEWAGGYLAQAFGLPCAAFAVVWIPEEMATPGLVKEFSELGVGPAFGSLLLPHVQEINPSHLNHVKRQFQADLLVFDWWMHNADRTLTAKGGNPNLLWDQDRGLPTLIDHNQAFDPDFDSQAFLELHVFAGMAQAVWNDLVTCAQYQSRLLEALETFDKACDSAPPEWWWFAEDVPTDFDRLAIRQQLDRCKDAAFWEVKP